MSDNHRVAPEEDQQLDYKSLRVVTSRPAWDELAGDCVCFANGSGGRLVVGVEDDKTPPPADQRIDPSLPERVTKRVKELTVNVDLVASIERHPTGGEVLVLDVARASGVASTSKGRYFVWAVPARPQVCPQLNAGGRLLVLRRRSRVRLRATLPKAGTAWLFGLGTSANRSSAMTSCG